MSRRDRSLARKHHSGPKVFLFSAAGMTSRGDLLNIGDEALSECLAIAIKSSRPDVQIVRSMSLQDDTLSVLSSGFISTRPLRALVGEVMRSDLVIIGGGTLIQPHRGLMRALLALTTVTSLTRTKAVITAIGAEPGDSFAFKKAARLVCRRVDSISTRDDQSRCLLEEISGRTVQLAADPILLYKPEAQLSGSSKMAVNLRNDAPDEFIRELAAIINHQLPDITEILLVAMDGRDDRDIAALKRLSNLITRSMTIRMIGPTSDWKSVLGAVGEASLCIGMRLHFLYFAALSGSRIVAVTSSMKSRSFASELNIAQVDMEIPGRLAGKVSIASPPTIVEFNAMCRRASAAVEQVSEAIA